MKLFGTRPNVINTFGLRIKQFLTASKRCSDILETSSYLTPWCIKSPKIVLDLVHLKKPDSNFSWKYGTSIVIIFLFLQMGIL